MNETNDSNLLIDLTKAVSKMEGVLSQVVSQQQAQIASTASAVEAVKVVSDNTAGIVSAHTVEIANLKVDVANTQHNQQGALARAMTVISPILAGIALFMAFAKDIYVR